MAVLFLAVLEIDITVKQCKINENHKNVSHITKMLEIININKKLVKLENEAWKAEKMLPQNWARLKCFASKVGPNY
jgi:hypothetical protein